MHRLVSPLLLVLLVAPAAQAARPITIRWHGQSFFEITSPQGTRLVLDPHAIEAYGRKSVNADVILMSHLHDDHTQVGVVANREKARAINALKEEKRFGRTVQEWNAVDEKIGDVHIQTMGTYHDNLGGMKRGKNGVFIIDIAGIRIVHLGDLGHRLSDAQVEKLGKVDVLLIPVGGVYTINGLVAADVVDQVKPRRFILPMHHGTLVYTDLLDASYFLDEMPPEMIKRYQTNELVLDADAPPPAGPTVAVLKWGAGTE